jgi:hypothetical protein
VGLQRLGGVLEHARQRVEDLGRLARHHPDRAAVQGKLVDQERDQAAGERVQEPAHPERVADRADHRDEHRRHGRLYREDRAAAQEHRGRQRQHGHDGDGRDRLRAERVGDEVRDQHADGHPDDDLHGPLHPLPAGDAQDDQRRRGREERLAVVQQPGRDQPGDRRGDGGLDDAQPVIADPAQAGDGESAGGGDARCNPTRHRTIFAAQLVSAPVTTAPS